MQVLRLKQIAGFLVFIALWMGCAQAHEIRPTIFTLFIDQDRSFELKADINLEALIAGIGSDHSDTNDAPNAATYNSLRQLKPAQLEEQFRAFAPVWLGNMGLTFDDASPRLELKSATIPEIGDTGLARQSDIVAQGRIPAGARTLKWAYPAQFGSSVLRIERPGQEIQSEWFPSGQASSDIPVGVAEQSTWLSVFVDYVVIGFTHIVPKGLDHILFVLGLFLLNQHWRPLVWQVTAFTVAHSVTLALGIYGIVNISPAIVEPLIALSIVYVAVENILTDRLHSWRPVIVFLFGLLHGLGFAGVLTDIGLQRSDFLTGLIAFNVGVEFGQLAIIAFAYIALYAFMKERWYRQRVVVPLSLGIAAMGAWWLVERTVM